MAVKHVNMTFHSQAITAIIGPSGCGKSTLIRCLNRLHEISHGGRVNGQVLLDGKNIYAADVDPVGLRRRIGMVFQKPTPFPTMSIFDNVAAGLKLTSLWGKRNNLGEIVEHTLKTGGPLGRSQRQTESVRRLPLRRTTAAFMHRPGPGRRAGDNIAG